MINIVTYEQAKSLNEVGFTEDCGIYYDIEGGLWREEAIKDISEVYNAPTIERAAKWFRDNYHLHITVDAEPYHGKTAWIAKILKTDSPSNYHSYNCFLYTNCDTFEDAMSLGVSTAIIIVKDLNENKLGF